jgi:DNA polymerase-1
MIEERPVCAIDFEYRQTDLCGELPEIRCFSAVELLSGKEIQVWADKLTGECPIDLQNSIVLAHNWKAEYSCFKALGWPDPAYPIDTMQEADRLRIWADQPYKPSSLKVLLSREQLPAIEEKEMRSLAMGNKRSFEYSTEERKHLLDYCLEDCQALIKLWPAIKSKIMPYMPSEEAAFYWAYRRAKYVFCCTDCDLAGIPIDRELFDQIVEKQPQIHAGLHRKLHDHYGCSDGVAHFKIKGLKEYISKHALSWPSTPTGKPKTDEETLNRMVARYTRG